MINDNTVVSIIPARGGSKGVGLKNIKIMAGRPLVYYQIKNALASKYIDDIVVTSDYEYILDYAKRFDVLLRRRPDELANDYVTLDPVIYDALKYAEKFNDLTYDIVTTQQPTSPLLRKDTLDNAIETLVTEELDTVVPVVEDHHLWWKKSNGKIIPDYKERLNRQQISPKYKETGAFLITRRGFVKKHTRFGDNVGIYILSEIECVDIDTPIDWYIAENLFKIIKIIFVVSGNSEIGMGHIYRSLTIADKFVGNEIIFVTYNSDKNAKSLIETDRYRLVDTQSYKDLLNVIRILSPNIVINDMLDTEMGYINKLKEMGVFVVNFEDLGDGSAVADLVFNALYEKNNRESNQRFGYEYECLNKMFHIYPPTKFNTIARNMLVSFGGVDINNLTSKVLHLIPDIISGSSITRVDIIIGPGYLYKERLMKDIEKIEEYNISLHCKIRNMAKMMSSADIALTSNGRTIYELASMGVPTISIAQNNRETLHLFARYHGGVKYLGMAQTISDEYILAEIMEIITDNQKRRQMYELQIGVSSVIRNGLNKIANEIVLEYEAWHHGES